MKVLQEQRSERQIQESICSVLITAGFRVLHTSAWRQKGASGVSPGVPDLLVWHDAVPGCALGLEVKKPKGKLSPAQKKHVEAGDYFIVRGERDACEQVRHWLILNVRPERNHLTAKSARVFNAYIKGAN